jgi:hypothetical protein
MFSQAGQPQAAQATARAALNLGSSGLSAPDGISRPCFIPVISVSIAVSTPAASLIYLRTSSARERNVGGDW